jgi:hypothetical protein
MKTIFLISGLAQHGKDSVANFLKQKLSGKTLILHNADYLKYIATAYMGWDGSKGIEGRNLLQYLGTERVRFDMKRPLYWVERTCDIIDILYDYYDFFCVPDTRFKNEIYYPLARFPGCVKTIRVNRLNFSSCLTPEQKNHSSEIDLVDFPHDIYINSESGLDNLEREVDEIISKL